MPQNSEEYSVKLRVLWSNVTKPGQVTAKKCSEVYSVFLVFMLRVLRTDMTKSGQITARNCLRTPTSPGRCLTWYAEGAQSIPYVHHTILAVGLEVSSQQLGGNSIPSLPLPCLEILSMQ